MTVCHRTEIINQETEIIKERIYGNCKDEKYNNQNEKFTIVAQQQILNWQKNDQI